MTTDISRRDFEYIVVGLGGLGAGTAYWLSRRAGADVLGLEQFPLFHERGASQDHSRIIRLAYDRAVYVDLARHSYAAWREVEAEAGESIVITSGGLDLFPPGAIVDPSGHVASMGTLGVPFEQLDAEGIMKRFPQFRVDDGTVGIYQADSGICAAAKANAAHLRLARQHGATILDETPVTSIEALSDGVEVSTARGTFRCRHLVLTADAWTNQLLRPLGLSIPLTSTQEQVAYYATPALREFHPDRFPIWIWQDNPCFYGLPVYGEMGGVKVAQDVGGREVTPETRSFELDSSALARVEAFQRAHMPTSLGPIASAKTCIYTMPPDRDFIIDTLPEYPQISLAVGAGHAFKFASVIGRILADLAIDGQAENYNIAEFAVDRPALTAVQGARSFEPYLQYNQRTLVEA